VWWKLIEVVFGVPDPSYSGVGAPDRRSRQESEAAPFHNWIDAIKDGVRDRLRDFIE